MQLKNIRVGHGFDVHRYSDDPDRKLVLAGCTFDGVPGLVGHSDADVIIHGCIDALLGPASLGDIGQLFPNSDSANKGKSSLVFLQEVVKLLADSGFYVINVDCTLVADQPKISDFRSEMINNLSEVIGAPVTIKGKTTEGAVQFQDSVSCHSVALVGIHE